MNKKSMIGLTFVAALAVAGPAAAADSTLDQIKSSKTLRLGYREGSIPFSFVGDDKQPRGYSIDLCKIVADDLAKQLKLEKLDVQWVPVTAQNRFDALKSRKIDVECGNTTQTLSRRADFDFSLMRVPDHGAALKALNDKQATAYAADRTVLVTTALASGIGKEFELSSAQFTYEPYGLTMRIDPALRLAVDRTLARLYRSGEIVPVFQRWFGPLGNPGEAIKVMFLLNGLPE